MANGYIIEQEDATRYLPHNPIGRAYTFYVYHGTERNLFTKQEQKRLVFSGSKSECDAFVARQVSA